MHQGNWCGRYGTNPEHIAKWWGPNGFTNTISKMEVEPEGEWEFIMHGPDGTDYKNKHIYLDIQEGLICLKSKDEVGKTMIKFV